MRVIIQEKASNVRVEVHGPEVRSAGPNVSAISHLTFKLHTVW